MPDLTPTQSYLRILGACTEARVWVGERPLGEAWDVCTNSAWMGWLLRAHIGYQRTQNRCTPEEYRRIWGRIFFNLPPASIREQYACPTW